MMSANIRMAEQVRNTLRSALSGCWPFGQPVMLRLELLVLDCSGKSIFEVCGGVAIMEDRRGLCVVLGLPNVSSPLNNIISIEKT